MADMPSEFWSGWIIALTVGSLAGLVWLILSIYFSKKNTKHFVSPVWDETLEEGNNPAPMWWFWLIFSALIISAVYLVLYPGLGSFSGTLKWSQGGRLDKNLTAYAYQHADMHTFIKQASVAELKQDADIMQSAERIFQQNCAACHGVDARGQAHAFPNLKDTDWQWGSKEADIEHSIRYGRQAMMVPWQDVLGDDGVTEIVNYIKVMSSASNSAANEKGHALYQQFCVACHGVTGEGNTALGAPNIVDDVWLYGNSDEQLKHTIALGRNGIMPAFDRRLSEAQIRMLVAWLSNQDY